MGCIVCLVERPHEVYSIVKWIGIFGCRTLRILNSMNLCQCYRILSAESKSYSFHESWFFILKFQTALSHFIRLRLRFQRQMHHSCYRPKWYTDCERCKIFDLRDVCSMHCIQIDEFNLHSIANQWLCYAIQFSIEFFRYADWWHWFSIFQRNSSFFFAFANLVHPQNEMQFNFKWYIELCHCIYIAQCQTSELDYMTE